METPVEKFGYMSKDILECEFFLLEELDCFMLVYHPYRPLNL